MINTDINIGIRYFIFILLSGFVVLYYFLGFGGLMLSDDCSYAGYAFSLTQGSFQVSEDIFSHRLGLIVPVALFYNFFGVTDVTTTIWPLLCFLLTGWVVWGTPVNKNAGIYALVIACLSFYPLYFSNKLFPDVIVSFFALGSAVLLWKYRKNSKRNLLFPLLFSISVFAGFVTKETMLFTLPFYALLLANDLVKKQNYFFWLLSFLVGLLLLGIYFGMYYFYTGDFLYRFHAIQEGHYVSGHSYFDKPLSSLIARITYEPLQMFIFSELFIPFALSLPVITGLRWRDLGNLDEEEKFWGILSVILLLMFWFASTSYKFYNPLSLNPRMYIMAVPVLSVVAGISLHKANTSSRIYLLYFFLFLAAALYCYSASNLKSTFLYAFPALIFAVYYVKNMYLKVPVNSLVLPLILIVLFLIHPVYSMLKTDRKNFQQQKEIIQTYLNTKGHTTIVVTDPLIRQCAPYFYSFVPNEDYSYVSYKEKEKMRTAKADNYFVLINPRNVQELMDTGYKVPEYFRNPPPHWQVIEKRGEVALYKVKGLADLDGI